MVRKDGAERFVRIDSSGIVGEAGDYERTICFIEDVTEARRLAEERRDLDERVQRAQAVESLGVLAAGVAHDFNNILVSILGTASLARMDLPEDAAVKGTLREIEVAATRAAELCDQLLACAGRGQVHQEDVDAHQLIRDMEPLLRSSVPAGVALQLVAAPGAAIVRADPTQVRQVVLNLVINAGEACSESGGRVLVRTSEQEVSRARLRTSLAGEGLPEGSYALLEVEDDGVGMDPALAGRLFDPYFTTRPDGRGLGLAAVMGIVRSHGGAMEMETEPGRGSVFRVLLPLGSGLPADTSWQTGECAPVGEARVLVVDDDPLVRRTVRRILQRAGHIVTDVEHGADALELLGRGVPVDVVLLDLRMPGMSGAQVYERLRAAGFDLPVVVMSGFAEEEMLRRFGDGLSGLVRKPFSAQALLVALDEALFDRHLSGPNAPVALREQVVLVVDDDPSVRRTCAAILENAGYVVRQAADGAEGLARYSPAVDLVLLDMLMPGLDGTETFEQLLVGDPAARVLFFCGSRIDQLRDRLLAAGARGVVRKPVAAEELVRAVEQALR